MKTLSAQLHYKIQVTELGNNKVHCMIPMFNLSYDSTVEEIYKKANTMVKAHIEFNTESSHPMYSVGYNQAIDDAIEATTDIAESVAEGMQRQQSLLKLKK